MMAWNPQPSQAATENPVIEAGEYAGKIIGAAEKRLPFKQSPKNPDGHCLVLQIGVVADTTRAKIEAILPADLGWLTEAMLRSAGQGDMIGKPFEADDLIGNPVRVEVSRFTRQNGSESNGIKKWLPPAKTAAKQQATAGDKPATVIEGVGSRRAKPAQADADDSIPF